MRSKKFNTVILIVLSFYIVYVLSVVFGLRDIIRLISFAAPIIIAVPCKNYWLVLMGVARCHGK